MLKRLYIAAFLVAFALAAWLVALQRQETLQASIPIENRTVMLESSNEKNQAQQQSAVQQRARIAPVPEEIFLKTIDLNLDDDEDFEQVIISRKSTSSQALSIVIAKFSPALGIYFRYFDGEIAATKSDSIIVQPEDVTGDGIVDLVVQGLDASNNQTLTIFRRLSDRGYAKVFSGRGASVVLQENTETEKPRAASIILVKRARSARMCCSKANIFGTTDYRHSKRHRKLRSIKKPGQFLRDLPAWMWERFFPGWIDSGRIPITRPVHVFFIWMRKTKSSFSATSKFSSAG